MEKEENFYVIYKNRGEKPVVITNKEGYAKSLLAGQCLGGYYDTVSKKGLLKIIERKF